MRKSPTTTPILAILLLLTCAQAEAEDRTSAIPSGSLGRVEMANSGAAEAQAAFLRGLAALHSFWYDEAADAFREAQSLDPNFALAYWGEAMTHNQPLWSTQDREAARKVLARLGETASDRARKAGSEREQAYLGTLEALYGDELDKDERDHAYAEALRQLSERYPEDDEAALFHSLALQGTQARGQRSPRVLMRSAAIAEDVFRRRPLHPGAAHYIIHAYDDPVHAPLGLHAARLYAKIAPEAHHALHMPSHIFVQLGMWDEAATSNEEAWAASVKWVEKRGHGVGKRDFHSLSWLHYIYLQQGRWRDAEKIQADVEKLAENGGMRPTGARRNMRARHAAETGRWPEIPLPEDTESTGRYNGNANQIQASGISALARGDLAAAKHAANLLEGLIEKPKRKTEDARYLRMLSHQLRGLAAQAGGRDDALEQLAEAASLERAMDPPMGPPSPFKPALETYGEALLEADQAELASEQFELSLARTPNRAASLLGAFRAAQTRGDAPAAARYRAMLLHIWHRADADLPALAETQRHGPPNSRSQAAERQ